MTPPINKLSPEPSEHPLQALTELGLRIEQANRLKQEGLTLTEKMAQYNIQPSSEPELRLIKETPAYKRLNQPFQEGHYTLPKHVGAIIAHRDLNKLLSHEEWKEQYFTDYPYASFFTHAMRIHREVGIPAQLALDALYIRTIIQSTDGFNTEVASKALGRRVLIDNGDFDEIVDATPWEDLRRSIDWKVLRGGVVITAFQVKTRKFANESKVMEADQLKNFAQNRLYQDEEFAPVFYLFKEDIDKGNFNPIPLDRVELLCFPPKVEEELDSSGFSKEVEPVFNGYPEDIEMTRPLPPEPVEIVEVVEPEIIQLSQDAEEVIQFQEAA